MSIRKGTNCSKYLCIALCILTIISFSTSCKKEDTKKSIGVTSYLITDFSGVDDEALNEKAWNGHLKAMDEIGIDIEYLTIRDASKYEAELNSLKDKKIDFLWGIGSTIGDALVKVAKEDTDTNYVCIDANINETLDNLKCIEFKVEEGAFLSGYFAAKITKSDTIGFLGAFKDTISDKYLYGFMAGAKHANESIKINIEYTEDYANKEKGREVGRKLFEAGCDTVLTASGYADLGCIEEADKSGFYVITVEYDKSQFANRAVVASVVKNIDTVVFEQLKNYVENKAFDQTNIIDGLSTGIVSFEVAEGKKRLLTEEIKLKLEELKSDIVEKSIIVPDTLEKFDEYK